MDAYTLSQPVLDTLERVKDDPTMQKHVWLDAFYDVYCTIHAVPRNEDQRYALHRIAAERFPGYAMPDYYA